MGEDNDIAPRWREMDVESRSVAYSPSSMVGGNIDPFIQTYIDQSAAAYATCENVKTIRYGPRPFNTVDVVVPKASMPVPLHIFVHGGYWQYLSKKKSFFAAPDTLAGGMAYAAIDYTLAPDATLDEIVAECVAAISKLVEEAPALGVDPDRIVLTGSSAGAHLAAMCCFNLPPNQRPRGVGLMSGIFELEPLIGTYINEPLSMDLDLAKRNSPMLADLTGFPPAIISWGENETDEFKRQSQYFSAKLKAAGAMVDCFEMAGRNHFDIVHEIANDTRLGRKMAALASACGDPTLPKYKPVFPDLIDASQVVASVDARPLGKTSDDSRAARVQETGGEPLLDFEGRTNPYIDYQSIDLLLSLQHPRSEGYDEMCFFVMGQVKELLFRGLHFELHNARAQIRDGNIADALIIVGRAGAYVDYITNSWNILSTITTEGFNEFRDHLSTASGQLSFMYRHVEFILGNKNKRLASAHNNIPHVWPAIEEALNAPSIYDAVIEQLAKAGYDIDARALKRDWSETYQSNDSVRAAWLKVYENPASDNLLYQVAEALIAVDEKMSLYRWRHFTSVHKIIGYKPGTGGSAGVGWLRAVTEHRFFPELWEIRNEM